MTVIRTVRTHCAEHARNVQIGSTGASVPVFMEAPGTWCASTHLTHQISRRGHLGGPTHWLVALVFREFVNAGVIKPRPVAANAHIGTLEGDARELSVGTKNTGEEIAGDTTIQQSSETIGEGVCDIKTAATDPGTTTDKTEEVAVLIHEAPTIVQPTKKPADISTSPPQAVLNSQSKKRRRSTEFGREERNTGEPLPKRSKGNAHALIEDTDMQDKFALMAKLCVLALAWGICTAEIEVSIHARKKKKHNSSRLFVLSSSH